MTDWLCTFQGAPLLPPVRGASKVVAFGKDIVLKGLRHQLA